MGRWQLFLVYPQCRSGIFTWANISVESRFLERSPIYSSLLRSLCWMVKCAHSTFGDGSKPIITIFMGINIHEPVILGYLGYQGFHSYPFLSTSPCFTMFESWLRMFSQHLFMVKSPCSGGEAAVEAAFVQLDIGFSIKRWDSTGFKFYLNINLFINSLVGGLEHFLFSHILGIIIPIDVHIFQRGSNHQPDLFINSSCQNVINGTSWYWPSNQHQFTIAIDQLRVNMMRSVYSGDLWYRWIICSTGESFVVQVNQIHL